MNGMPNYSESSTLPAARKEMFVNSYSNLSPFRQWAKNGVTHSAQECTVNP